MLVGVICFSLFWTVFELGSIISHAIFGALLNDVVPRELLGRFFGLFRIVGLVDGIIFNFWILGYIPAHFTLIVASIGIFYGITFMWMSLKIKEGDYPPVATEAGDGDQKGVFARRWDGIKLYFRECYANPFYISVFLMLTLSRLAFLPVNTFAIPYARSLEVSMGTYGNYAAWMLCVSLVLAYPIGWLADLFHPIRLAMGALVAHIVICIWATFYATSADGFLLAFLLHGVAAGTYGTSAASLHQRLYPRLKFAQFASAGGILGSICTMTLTPLVGMLIDYSGNNYRHTFIIGGFLALSGLGFGLIVYSKLRKKDAALPQE